MSDQATSQGQKAHCLRRRRFRGRLAVAPGVTALVGGLIAPTRGPAVEDAAPVGLLSISMVEMLGDADGTTPMELEQLRNHLSVTDKIGDGSGVDVAVIDTGVAPVVGLDGTNKVLHGPDLSFEGQTAEAAYLDTYGHGTHMAATIAGNRPDQNGIAPGARIVSVKVAGHDGITTVPQVVAAIDW